MPFWLNVRYVVKMMGPKGSWENFSEKMLKVTFDLAFKDRKFDV